MADRRARPRDAAATRSAILQAARLAFTGGGFDAVGVREIAGAAGVSASLVNRYFESKERLFAEAVPETFSVTGLLSDERHGFGERLARYLLSKTKDDGNFDPTLAMLRSASSRDAREMLREGMDRLFVEPLAAWLGGTRATERAAMMVALLSGVSVMRDVLMLRAFADADVEELIAILGAMLQRLVDPPGE